MHGIYELKENLVQELEEFGQKPITMESLKTIDTLAHAAKNVCKVLEACENEEASGRMSRDYGNSGRRRDSMGRFSRDSGMSRDGYGMSNEGSYRGGMSREGRSYGGDNQMVVEQLEQLMANAADDRTRGKFRELIRDMRNS